jgi:hypothetical protein
MATAGADIASVKAEAETIVAAEDMPPITATLPAVAAVEQFAAAVEQFAAVVDMRRTVAVGDMRHAAAADMQRLRVTPPVERVPAVAVEELLTPQQHAAVVVVVDMPVVVAADMPVAAVADTVAADTDNR